MYEVYVCELCGNVVEVVKHGGGKLVCCGQAMTLKTANTVDAAKEKHVPVISIDGNKITVTVGSTAHPMQDDHWITWIEVIEGERVKRQYLKSGDEPKATFCYDGGKVTAREYCNKHGLWSADK
jgi:superoxide reductase